MAHVVFPFWILRTTDLSPSKIDLDVVAFSSVERATAYLNAQMAGRGELKLVSRQSMRRLIAELQQQKLLGLRLDPASDGTGGDPISLAELLGEVRP
jgi:hypothetical protein